VYVVTTADPQRKSNAAVLLGALAVLQLGRSAEEAYRPLTAAKPFAPFRDASCGPSTYHLTVLDCLRGLARARDAGLLDFRSPPGGRPGGASFDCAAYEHFEQVENGDLNWAVPGNLIAFSGPHARRTRWAGFASLAPEDYWAPFAAAGVTAVVRLNKRLYDRRRFTEGGFRHHELFFPDGSCPTPALVERFCALVEAEPGVVAVHCKAGLGRTGVLIGLYIMKHFGFSANEALGYLRIVRPGSIIGPQQHFLCDWERRMWAAGDAFRAAASPPPRLPQPRVSHGGGGAYDDGDISDEDADHGEHAGYDDGGYTSGASPPRPPPATPTLQGGGGERRAQYSPLSPLTAGPPPRAATLPAPLRMSPTKPMHSGTRPSLLYATGGAGAGGGGGSSGRLPPLRGTQTVSPPRGGGGGGGAQRMAASTSGDEGSGGGRGSGYGLQRRASLRAGGYYSDTLPPSLGAATAGRLAGSSALRRSGTMPPAFPASPEALSPARAGTAVDRMGLLRRSMIAALSFDQPPPRGRGGSGLAMSRSLDAAGGLSALADAPASPQRSGLAPAESAHEALLRSLSTMSTRESGGGASAPPPPRSPQALPSSASLSSSPTSALRLVTASGQPRKLPAGAVTASGTYANAFFARVAPADGDA
jgi:cell division cycle 14